jgi:two-component system, OmpR family, phosphate regulon sensor histidine kinase PhoR
MNMILESPLLLDAFRDALIAFDAALRVTELNRAAGVLFGVTRERAINRPLIEVVRDHRLERLAIKGGELELDLPGSRVLVRSLNGILIFEDVTTIRAREHELREVMAILSHEFRTPVTAVKGLLEALQLDPPFETQKRFLEMSLVEVERLVRLSEDLTVGFRPQAQRSFPLNDAISRVLRLLEEERKRRGVNVIVSGAELIVHCDPDKLVQVLLNLFENALRHGPNPGEVHLQASLESWFGMRASSYRLTITSSRRINAAQTPLAAAWDCTWCARLSVLGRAKLGDDTSTVTP